MKKKILVVLALLLCVLFTGCDQILEMLDGAVSETKSQEEIYSELASLAGSPSSKSNLSGKFTFVACIISEPYKQTFEDDDKEYFYQEAYIERNMDKVICLDVTSLEETLPAGDYAKITGTVKGSIYWTENNKKTEVLDIKVSAMEAFALSEDAPDTENKLVLSTASYSGEIEFVGAHRSEDSFGKECMIVYLKFKNTAPESNVKFSGVRTLMSLVDAFHGDYYVERNNSFFSLEGLDPQALDGGDMQAYTPTGKSQLYYFVYSIDPDAAEDTPFYFDVYSDEFAWTNSIEVPISSSYEEIG